MANNTEDALYNRAEGFNDEWDDSELILYWDASMAAFKEARNVKESIKEKEKSWKVGDYCQVEFDEDDVFYEAKIVKMKKDKDTCIVEYFGYGDELEVELKYLKPSKGKHHREKQKVEARLFELEIGEEEEEEEATEEVPSNTRKDNENKKNTAVNVQKHSKSKKVVEKSDSESEVDVYSSDSEFRQFPIKIPLDRLERPFEPVLLSPPSSSKKSPLRNNRPTAYSQLACQVLRDFEAEQGGPLKDPRIPRPAYNYKDHDYVPPNRRNEEYFRDSWGKQKQDQRSEIRESFHTNRNFIPDPVSPPRDIPQPPQGYYMPQPFPNAESSRFPNSMPPPLFSNPGCNRFSSSMPPPPPIPGYTGQESEPMFAMLMSWYMTGYQTGYYMGLKDAEEKSRMRP